MYGVFPRLYSPASPWCGAGLLPLAWLLLQPKVGAGQDGDGLVSAKLCHYEKARPASLC